MIVHTMVAGPIQLRKIVGPIVPVPDDCDQRPGRLYRWWRWRLLPLGKHTNLLSDASHLLLLLVLSLVVEALPHLSAPSTALGDGGWSAFSGTVLVFAFAQY